MALERVTTRVSAARESMRARGLPTPTPTRVGNGRARARRPSTPRSSARAREGEGDEDVSVFLIGAGPGGVEQMTMGAARALASCDAVVHDDLGASSSDVLELATKEGVEVIAVGKRGGASASWRQSDICDLICELARRGKKVARLKGGCPSVFARVSDEISALRAAGVSYKMIPGISSALSAPLSVGVPLTDRDLGRHFSVTSAHDPDAIDFSAFVGIDTCVFLMVGKSLSVVVERLVRDARKPSTMTCCVIRNGMQADERSWFGTLDDIVERTSGESLSPCVLVVGDVVTLA